MLNITVFLLALFSYRLHKVTNTSIIVTNNHFMSVLLSQRLLWHYFGNPALFLFLKACVSHWLWKDTSPRTLPCRNVPGCDPVEHILLANYVPCCLPLFPDHSISNAILPLTDNTAFSQLQTFTPLPWNGHAPNQSEISCGLERSKVHNRGGDVNRRVSECKVVSGAIKKHNTFQL